MKKVLFLFLCSFALSPLKAAADGTDPEVEIFEDPVYVQNFYDKLVKDNQIDTSFKFKHKALNGVLLGRSMNVWKSYTVVTKDKIFSVYFNQATQKEAHSPLYQNCDILKDEIDYTLLRCPVLNKYVFYEYKANYSDVPSSISEQYYTSDSAIFDSNKLVGYSWYLADKIEP